MEINHNAPVIARAEIQIAASPETVWQWMANIDGWPDWNPDVKSVRIEGPPAPGTPFVWRVDSGTIRSVIQFVEGPHTLAWTGSRLGIQSLHVWRIRPKGSGALAGMEESWEGLIPSLLRRRMRRNLHNSIERSLHHLQQAVERLARL
jgi:uncharacterized protein YndB with AHSA1/START domain